MLCADFVPTYDNSSLEERKGRFDGIGMDVGSEAHILFGAVVDRLMLMTSDRLSVCRQFVGHDHVNIFGNILSYVPCKSSALSIIGMKEAQSTATLTYANDDLFLVSFAAPSTTVSARLAAHVGFVHLDSTVQQFGLHVTHGPTYTVTEIPS